MYSSAKFRTDHIFLQNRDRKNIKKFEREVRRAQSWAATGWGRGEPPAAAVAHNARA
jgi:hypothetical protein